jgi:hypothetical protein
MYLIMCRAGPLSVSSQICKNNPQEVEVAIELWNVANLDFDISRGQLLVAIRLAIEFTHPM